jgi:UDP-N-acetylglucosamine/UDP-N-acetylgalactosamine diphosphorylase
MSNLSDELRRRLRRHGHEHVLRAWDRLGEAERAELHAQLSALDLEGLARMHAERDRLCAAVDPARIEPAPIVTPPTPEDDEARRAGEEALARGEVAVLLVAGGQGTRLGFEHPKGMYPVGPVTQKPLFQVHAEKVLALRRRCGAAVPFLVMTSQATHEPTERFFGERGCFGLPRDEVFFFQQGTMPSLDLHTGKLLMEQPHRLCLSPDGHGGTLTALSSSSLLEQMKRRGIKHIFYFQVDNSLVKIADPTFLGLHLRRRSEASSKVIAKAGPAEKMGVFAQIDGRCSIIEYSDLPDELARQTDERGRLRLWAGNPAIHLFDLGFLERVTTGPNQIPFHMARKKVPHVDEAGRPVTPAKENALKFERFIFDVLPLAERWLLVESARAEEFAPLKNAEGADSPATVERALSGLTAAWLEAAGVAVPRRPDGSPAFALEVCPLFALDADEFAGRVDRATTIEGPSYFG